MKKSNIILIVILTGMFAVCQLSAKTFLWEVKSETGKVYILGSIHIGDSTLYPLDNIIEDLFAKSDFLVLELDISQVQAVDVLKYTMLPDTLTLAGAVDSATYADFKSLFEKHRIPYLSYFKLKPWFAVMTLQSLELSSADYAPAYGIDMYFLDKAQERNLKIKQLESLEFQMSVLDTLNSFTGEFLEQTLKNVEQSGSMLDSIITAWKNGDISAMDKLINTNSDLPNFDKIMHHINYSRNYNMVDKIEQFLNEKGVHFVVVGAAHLIGREGIIELLNKKNKYIITQQ